MIKFKSSRSTTGGNADLLELEKPRVPAALPLLADEDGILTIPLVDQNRPLEVVIDREWPGYDAEYEAGKHLSFAVAWKSHSATEFVVVQTLPDIPMPVPGNWTPVVGAVPISFLQTPGVFDVAFRVTVVETGNPHDTPPTSVHLDKTAPNSNNPGVQLVLDEPTPLIDQAYLIRHNDQVPAGLTPWLDIRLEDVVELFLEPSRGAISDPVGRLVIGPEHLGGAPIALAISGDAVRRKGDGARFIYYRLIDRAGNAGPVSAAIEVQVSLGAGLLEPVVIRGITGNNVLVAADAGRPVTVELRLHNNPVEGEILELHWGSYPDVVSRYVVKATDIGGQVITFDPVPYAVVEAVGDGPAIPVYYFKFDGVDRQRSPDTLVRVAIAPIAQFERVSFPSANLWGWINCASAPWTGIPVFVPGAPLQLAAGDVVELSWQLFRGGLGTGDPLTPEVYLPGHPLSANEAREGVELRLTPQHFIDLVLNPLKEASSGDGQAAEGSANVAYRVTKGNGQSGLAIVAFINISLQRPGGAICEGP